MCIESSFPTLVSKVMGGNTFLREIHNFFFSFVLANSIVQYTILNIRANCNTGTCFELLY